MKSQVILHDCKQTSYFLKYARNITSQGGEDGIIEQLFQHFPKPLNRSCLCVDVGAWDGIHLSNTHHLLKDHQWDGVLFEANQSRCSELQETYHNEISLKKVNAVCAIVDFQGPNSLKGYLSSLGIPKDFEFLSIDVDGADFHIWKSLVCPINPSESYSPSVVCIEFNPTIPNNIYFVQEPLVSVQQGSSLLAITLLGLELGYTLVCTTTFNGFFVRNDLLSYLPVNSYYPIQSLSSSESLEENTHPPPPLSIQPSSIELLSSPLHPVAVLSLLHSQGMSSFLFQTYDGHLALGGTRKLLWHRTPINPQKIQVLPPRDRKFPFAPPSSPSSSLFSHQSSGPSFQTLHSSFLSSSLLLSMISSHPSSSLDPLLLSHFFSSFVLFFESLLQALQTPNQEEEAWELSSALRCLLPLLSHPNWNLNVEEEVGEQREEREGDGIQVWRDWVGICTPQSPEGQEEWDPEDDLPTPTSSLILSLLSSLSSHPASLSLQCSPSSLPLTSLLSLAMALSFLERGESVQQGGVGGGGRGRGSEGSLSFEKAIPFLERCRILLPQYSHLPSPLSRLALSLDLRACSRLSLSARMTGQPLLSSRWSLVRDQILKAWESDPKLGRANEKRTQSRREGERAKEALKVERVGVELFLQTIRRVSEESGPPSLSIPPTFPEFPSPLTHQSFNSFVEGKVKALMRGRCRERETLGEAQTTEG